MKITKAPKKPDKIKFKTQPSSNGMDGASVLAEWWKAKDDAELAMQLCGTAAYLKTQQTYRIRQLATSVRLYCGLSVYNYAGSNVSKIDKTKTLPDDRPTFNVISSAADTLCSRLTQNKPEPKFLTDGADYKQRHLAEQLNRFIIGEFYQTHAYEKGAKILRDGAVMGPGALKVYENDDEKVAIDRVMVTDLYTDDNDSLNGEPQQLIQIKLVDRDKFMANHPRAKGTIALTPQSYPDNASDSGRTTANQIMVVEGWKLPSCSDRESPNYVPGRHTIATVNGIIDDELWHRKKFPFVFFNYCDPFLGIWGTGLGTRLFGNQMAINRINYTISKAINLIGVPRVFVESSSKVSKAHLNNEIGVIIPYSGTKPSYEIAQCNAPELYEERDKLIEYSFRQEGISNMQATGQKPVGLNSGEAIRSADDINSDRFSETGTKYEKIFIDLAYLVVDTAMDICKRTGKYQTVYPNKDGTKEIDLPQMEFLKNPFVIQCFSESSLPRTPSGRMAAITERVQAGMLTIKEGRRLMKYQDLEENERLDNASEERIFKILDEIVEDGKFTPPDPFLDLELATTLVVQYINLYRAANLEKKKDEMLEKFFNLTQALIQASQPAPMEAPAITPPANPMPTPTSPLIPNTNAQAA